MQHKFIVSSQYLYNAILNGNFTEKMECEDRTLSIAGKKVMVECSTEFSFIITQRQFDTLRKIVKIIPEQPIVITLFGDDNGTVDFTRMQFEF